MSKKARKENPSKPATNVHTSKKKQRLGKLIGWIHRAIKWIIRPGFFLLIGLGTSAYALFMSNDTLISGSETATFAKIDNFIIRDTLLAMAAVTSFSIMSIIVANKARKNVATASVECEYCGEANAKIVCGKCDSVLYYQLVSPWKIVNVFFAHHRWQMTSVLFAVLLVIPFGGAYQLRNKLAARAESFAQETQAMISATNIWRNSLMQMHNAFPDSIPAHLGQEFLDNYFIFSWSVPRLLDYYRMHRCEPCDFDPNTMLRAKVNIANRLTQITRNDKIVRLDFAFIKTLGQKRSKMGCLFTQENLFPDLVTKNTDPATIVDYLDYYSLQLSETLRIGSMRSAMVPTNNVKFKESVNVLFYVGKAAASILESLAFGPDQDPKVNYNSTANEYLLAFIAGSEAMNLSEKK